MRQRRGREGQGAVTPIYVTVHHYGATRGDPRPFCGGCTPVVVDGSSGRITSSTLAEYQIVGASGTIALCRNCALHSIKSLAARFMLFDRSATRDLMDFFAAEMTKKRPPTGKRRRAPKSVIDVIVPLLLEGKKRS